MSIIYCKDSQESHQDPARMGSWVNYCRHGQETGEKYKNLWKKVFKKDIISGIIENRENTDGSVRISSAKQRQTRGRASPGSWI